MEKYKVMESVILSISNIYGSKISNLDVYKFENEKMDKDDIANWYIGKLIKHEIIKPITTETQYYFKDTEIRIKQNSINNELIWEYYYDEYHTIPEYLFNTLLAKGCIVAREVEV